jgi:hypothetical protein
VLFYDGERIEIRIAEPVQFAEKLHVALEIIESDVASDESGILRVTSTKKATFKPTGL